MNGDRTPRDMTARPPTRCLSCDDRERPIKARGLCDPCYGRARGRGIHVEYPTCGRREVPFRDHRERIYLTAADYAPGGRMADKTPRGHVEERPSAAQTRRRAIERARAVAHEGAPAAAHFAALDRFWGRAGGIAP